MELLSSLLNFVYVLRLYSVVVTYFSKLLAYFDWKVDLKTIAPEIEMGSNFKFCYKFFLLNTKCLINITDKYGNI